MYIFTENYNIYQRGFKGKDTLYLNDKKLTLALFDCIWSIRYGFNSLSGSDPGISCDWWPDLHANAATSHIISMQVKKRVLILSKAVWNQHTSSDQMPLWVWVDSCSPLFPVGMCQMIVFKGWTSSFQQALKAELMEGVLNPFLTTQSEKEGGKQSGSGGVASTLKWAHNVKLERDWCVCLCW